MNTTDLERQVAELRLALEQLSERVNKADAVGSENAREVGALNVKIDAIRDDLKELKHLGNSYVQRPEIDNRLQSMKERVDSVDSAVKALDLKVSQGFTDIRKDQQHILMVLYGTFITVLLAAVGMAVGFLK